MSSLENSIIDGNFIIGTVRKIPGQVSKCDYVCFHLDFGPWLAILRDTGYRLGIKDRRGRYNFLGVTGSSLWPRVAGIFTSAEIGCICFDKAFLFFQEANFCRNMRNLC